MSGASAQNVNIAMLWIAWAATIAWVSQFSADIYPRVGSSTSNGACLTFNQSTPDQVLWKTVEPGESVPDDLQVDSVTTRTLNAENTTTGTLTTSSLVFTNGVEVDTIGKQEYAIPVELANSTHYISTYNHPVATRYPLEAVAYQELGMGVSGGTFNSGDWRVRELNTLIDYDNLNVSLDLGTSILTIPPGLYHLSAYAHARGVLRNTLRIQDLTNGVTIVYGHSYTPTSDGTEATPRVDGRLQTNTTVEIQLQHQCASSKPTDGFGVFSTYGPSIYVWIRITQLG